MDLGEPLASIRKVAKVRRVNAPPESMIGIVSRLHSAYHFRPEAYRFVGIGEEVLVSAGVVESGAARGRATKPVKRPPHGA
jgi:hypothetical protein